MILSRIIPLFSEADIPYCIVGGYAVALHGVVRGTLDLDIIILVDSHWGNLPVIDLDGLIHMKSKTTRDQDREDVKSLKSLQKYSPKNSQSIDKSKENTK